MERVISEICNLDLKKAVFKDAQFIMIAEGGAMGEAGAVVIVTKGGSIFHCNYVYGDIRPSKLFRVLPVLKDWNDGVYDDKISVHGWSYEYLGAGNHLIIKEEVSEAFHEIVGMDMDPSVLYGIWLDVAWKIVEENCRGKLPIETKGKEELMLLMRINERDMKTHGVRELSEEERILEDLEAGYDPFEDERVYVTPELVHGDDIPSSQKVVEGFFSDGRSYMSELWFFDLITSVTYYFPVDDPLSGVINDKKEIEDHLMKQGKILAGEEHPMGIKVLDTKEGKIYSVTVSVGCDDELYCEAYM